MPSLLKPLLFVTVVAAACGGKTSSTTPTGTTPTPAGPVYLPLFEQGRSWTFALSTKTTPPSDMGEPSTDDAGTMTCTVAMAHDMGATKMAKVVCRASGDTDPGDGNAPSGYWVATPDGLWGFDGSQSMDQVHAEIGKLDPKTMLIAAAPAERRQELGDADGGGDDGPEGLSVYAAKPGAAGAWCVSYVFALGDEAGWEMCLAADRGIVAGSWFQAGATVVETSYVAK
ncbi:MAG: hypothetical protein R3B06_02680 [Kofleriaceae bacterium]